MKKELISFSFLAIFSQTCMAQSTDAAYPIGRWQTDQEKKVSVELYITREAESPSGSCGTITAYNNETDKDVFEGALIYDGKGMENDMSNGIYYFKVQMKNGSSSRIGVKKSTEGASIISVTGSLKDSPYLKEKFGETNYSNGSLYDNTPFATNEKELIDALKEAERDNLHTPGFGNRKLYISTHEKLDPSKPKYAKAKGTGAINIRAKANAQAAKVGELKPNETLLVTNEYNGWCEVKLNEKTTGWISLTVVALTNVPGSTPAFALPAEVDGHMAFLGISLGETPNSMKEKLVAKGLKFQKPEYEGNGITLTGMVYGATSRVEIGIAPDKSIYDVALFSTKPYRLPQAKARFKELVAQLEAIYGKASENNGFTATIKTAKGQVVVEYFNEDEVEESSEFFIVVANFSEKKQ